MSKEWKEVNLPFSDPGRGHEVAPPNLDLEIAGHFGVSYQEVMQVVQHPEQSREYARAKIASGKSGVDFLQEWLQSPTPYQRDYAVALKTLREMDAWEMAHPKMAEYAQHRQREHLEGTFKGLGLVRPGVQIEMEDGNRYLIGDINPNMGVCGNYTAFRETAVVARYRVLIEE